MSASQPSSAQTCQQTLVSNSVDALHPPTFPLSLLPASVLSHCIAPFLSDVEAVALAVSSKASFAAWHAAPYYYKSPRYWMLPSDFEFASAGRKELQRQAWTSTYPDPALRIGQLRNVLLLTSQNPSPEWFASLLASIPSSVRKIWLKTGTNPRVPIPCPISSAPFPDFITDLDFGAACLPPAGPPLAPLPPRLRSLVLPWHLSQSHRWQEILDFAWPDTLEILNLAGAAENRSLADFVYPPNLTTLNTGEWRGRASEFARSPPPMSLQTLVVPNFAHELELRALAGTLPPTLTELVVTSYPLDPNLQLNGNQDSGDTIPVETIDKGWPRSLRKLVLNDFTTLPDLPEGLEIVEICGTKSRALSDLQLPSKLRQLLFNGHSLDGPATMWPKHLTSLSVLVSMTPFLLTAKIQWTSSLTELELGGMWNLPVEQLPNADEWPPNLRKLRLGGNNFNSPVDKLRLPRSLRWLGFGPRFNQPIAGVLQLPPELERLHLGTGTWFDGFGQSLRDMVWPSSLRALYVPFKVDHLPPSELPLHLPSSLQSVHRLQSRATDSDTEALDLAWSKLVEALPNCVMIMHPGNTRLQAGLQESASMEELSWREFQ